MNKVIAMLAMFAFVVVSFAADGTTSAVSNTVKYAPGHTQQYTLHTRSTGQSIDTFASQNVKKVYGPYPLCNGDNQPQWAGFQVIGDAITGTSPVMSVDYQVISGLTMKDTVSAWTAACTLGTAAINSYFSLASKAGSAIVVRVHNYDATQSEIPGLLKVYFKDGATNTRNIQ